MGDYVLRRRHTPGRCTWTLRATRRRLVQAANEGANLVVECGGADSMVRFVIPVGPGSVFDREVFPRLTFDGHGQGSCTFDVSRSYQFTWRGGVRFDGSDYLADEGPTGSGGQL